jgi:sugar phosphate isomerase/epimerase
MSNMKNTSTLKNVISGLKVLTIIVILFTVSFTALAKGKPSSKFGGVQIGVITYSYRSMPDKSLVGILDYVVQSGINSVELMGQAVEEFAGIPKTPDEIRQWRTSVSMKEFKKVRKMFKDKGIKIDILKLGNPRWSDEEIDYAFNVCKTLGARGISMEVSEETAKKMAPFAEKHKLFVILHNHAQPADPNFSFDKILSHGPNIMLNFDAGHYFGATGLNPNDLIERLHSRIVSIHVKDKTGPNASPANQNMPFGQGQTPVAEMLQLIQKNKWPITCDIELEYTIPENSNAVLEVIKCLDYCRSALTSK